MILLSDNRREKKKRFCHKECYNLVLNSNNLENRQPTARDIQGLTWFKVVRSIALMRIILVL